MESIECVLCRQSESRPAVEDNGFVGRQCADCGLIFVSPRPSQHEMDAMYEDGRAYLSAEFFVDNAEFLSDRLHARREVRRLRRFSSGGSLLEIGPGSGTFLEEARRNGFRVYGVELNPKQAEFIRSRRGIPCVDSMDQIPSLGPERFDVVYHCSVLSHFHDPIAEFTRFRDLLGGGGYLMFETGNLADVDHKYFSYVESFQYPDHLFFFGDASIRSLLAQTGFEHVRTYRYSNMAESAVRARISRLRGGSGGGSAGHRTHDSSPEQLATSSGAAAPLAASGTSPEQPATSSESGNRDERRVFRGAGMLARQALDLFYYGLGNTFGNVRPKPRGLQTLIVVARKA